VSCVTGRTATSGHNRELRAPRRHIESHARELAEENERAEPLSPGTPVAPHAVTECVGISPVGRWCAAALEYLEAEGALKPNMGPGGDIVGYPR
jgi:hypothetical protein